MANSLCRGRCGVRRAASGASSGLARVPGEGDGGRYNSHHKTYPFEYAVQ